MSSKIVFYLFGLVMLAHVILAKFDLFCKYVENHRNLPLLASISQCGNSKSDSFYKIMVGSIVKIGEMPWMVSLVLFGNVGEVSVNMHFCGGTLISDKLVLTAAHCVKDFYDRGITSMVLARVGENILKNDIDCDGYKCAPKYIDHKVELIIVHEEFSMKTRYNDIALLKLADRVQFNDFVSPICLPITCNLLKEYLVGKQVTVAGWGELYGTHQEQDLPGESEYSSQPNYFPLIPTTRLRKLKSTVAKSPEECPYFQARPTDEEEVPTLESQICAGGEDNLGNPKGSACPGDSGGPLSYETEVNGIDKHIQVGIVSTSDFCVSNTFIQEVFKRPRRASTYTRVMWFMPWILDNLSD